MSRSWIRSDGGPEVPSGSVGEATGSASAGGADMGAEDLARAAQQPRRNPLRRKGLRNRWLDRKKIPETDPNPARNRGGFGGRFSTAASPSAWTVSEGSPTALGATGNRQPRRP